MAEPAVRSLPSVPETEWMRALPPALRLVLHGAAPARAAAATVWGVPFSEQACRARAQSGRATLWLGPDEYLLLGSQPAEHTAETVSAALEQALNGLPHALVDVSHRQFALEVRGPKAELILNAVCPLDLHLSAFPSGMCTRTVLAKADIVLWRTRDDAFHLEVWRSFHGYVSGLLSEIAGEFYAE
jgi:sarcosine oxidase subunit gamma